MPAKKKETTKTATKKTSTKKKEDVVEEIIKEVKEEEDKKAKKKTTKKATSTKKETTKKEKASKTSEDSTNEKVLIIDEKAKVTPKGNIITIDENAKRTSLKFQEKELWKEIEEDIKTGKSVKAFIEGVESEPSLIMVSSYKGKRVIIPLEETGIRLITDVDDENERNWRLEKALSSMVGAPTQIVLKGADKKNNMIAASRKEALDRNKVKFYSGESPVIQVGSVAEGRVIAVKEKSVRLDVFGVSTSMGVRELKHEWIADARDHYSVGDILTVLVEGVSIDDTQEVGSPEWCDSITINVSAKALLENKTIEAYNRSQIGGRYIGKVTNINNQLFYVSLSNGANAIAQSRFTNPKTLVGDTVCFVVKNKEDSSHLLTGVIVRTISTEYK